MHNMGRFVFESFVEAVKLDPKNACALTHCGTPYEDEGRLVNSVKANRLQQKLQEEMDLHSVLESAIKKNASELSSPLCLLHHVQELLSHIAVLEGIISKLEQEMVSLQFQLSQERNERRLADYFLRH